MEFRKSISINNASTANIESDKNKDTDSQRGREMEKERASEVNTKIRRKKKSKNESSCMIQNGKRNSTINRSSVNLKCGKAKSQLFR